MNTKLLMLLLVVIFGVACQPETVLVETTVQVPATVEVTREVTRIVEVQTTAEVTRLVEVTRIVAVTPRPEDTPVPTATPEVLTTAVNFLVGNFDLNNLPKAPEGSVAVVASGPINRRGNMPIVAHNNTGLVIREVSGSAVVRAADGSLLGTGNIEWMFPMYVLPGGWIIGEIEFNETMPADAGYEINLAFQDASADPFLKDLEVVEHNIIGNRMVGFLRNSTGVTIENIGVVFTCLDEAFSPISHDTVYIDQDTVSNGQQAAFDAEFEGNCPQYLVAARGYEP